MESNGGGQQERSWEIHRGEKRDGSLALLVPAEAPRGFLGWTLFSVKKSDEVPQTGVPVEGNFRTR